MRSIHHLPAGEASKLTRPRHPRPRPEPQPAAAGSPSPVTERRRTAIRRLTGYIAT
jgi:hypothetical protein